MKTIKIISGSLALMFISILVAYGQQSSAIVEVGIVINGVKWATRNIDTPGNFVAKPEDVGLLYKSNSKVAWPTKGDLSNWDTTEPDGGVWEKSNDPSPHGWRVPTPNELESLLDKENVNRSHAVVNGVGGYRFTDKATGKSIFMPYTPYRTCSDGKLYDVKTSGRIGYYWSSKIGRKMEFFESGFTMMSNTYSGHGMCIRPVAQ